MLNQATGPERRSRPLGHGHGLAVARRADDERDALALVEERFDALAALDATLHHGRVELRGHEPDDVLIPLRLRHRCAP